MFDFLQGFDLGFVIDAIMPVILLAAGWLGLKIKDLLEKNENQLVAIGVQAVARLVDEVVEYFAATNPDSDEFRLLDQVVDKIMEKAELAGLNINEKTARRLAEERINVLIKGGADV